MKPLSSLHTFVPCGSSNVDMNILNHVEKSVPLKRKRKDSGKSFITPARFCLRRACNGEVYKKDFQSFSKRKDTLESILNFYVRKPCRICCGKLLKDLRQIYICHYVERMENFYRISLEELIVL